MYCEDCHALQENCACVESNKADQPDMNSWFDGFSGYIEYKNRYPDPGRCKVLSIDFEEKKLCVTNQAVRLYPSFNEVNFIEQ
ncbi:MAG: hypothetical protein QM500_15025 [Methylococcales bacterium]